MKIFLDTADPAVISEAVSMGLCDGVTTNPSLIAKAGGDNATLIPRICAACKGPVLAETLSIDAAGIVAEGRELRRIADNVVVKIPMGKDGLKAVHALSAEKIPTAVTLIFNATQALLAARAGATYIAPFVGRVDDLSEDGTAMIGEIVDIYSLYDLPTQVIVASVRHPLHVKQVALAGAHAVTIPPDVLDKLTEHPLTAAGIAKFLADAKKA
ncbi:MAG: fructose-6-phosphate aldolase [Deltaproteobacteria bacterium]|nr:fructose-6-phosphate aldolase [Deltaproteobacteria bacterium]